MAPLKDPVRVAVTGAAGQIGYSLLFRIASGSMLGPDQPVILQMLEITPALEGLAGRRHGARGLRLPAARRHGADRRRRRRLRRRRRRRCSSAPCRARTAWSAPTSSAPTAGSSSPRARPSSRSAQRDVKVLVVGNPANTNALIAQRNAKDLDPRPLHRHDAPRPQPRHRPAGRQGRRAQQRRHQDDDLGQPLRHPVPRRLPRRGRRQAGLRRPSAPTRRWLEDDFIPTVQQRGAAIIKARGLSSAASAANAAVDHVRSLGARHAGGRLGVDGRRERRQLRRPRGHHLGFPCTAQDGEYEIVQGLDIDEFSRARIDKSNAELVDERDAVEDLGLI